MPVALLDLTALGTDSRRRGIGRYLSDLGAGLAELGGDDPRVVALTDLGPRGEATTEDDLARAVATSCSPGRAVLAHKTWAWSLRLGLRYALARLRPDLVHSGHPNATPLGRLPCPRVVTAHDLVPLRFPDRYLTWEDGYLAGRQRLDARRYRSAERVIAISEATAGDLVTLLGLAASRIDVVHNGVDLARFSAEPRADDAERVERLGLARPYALYVGAADFRKNAEGMLQALMHVRRARPDLDLELAWAAGLDDRTRAQLEARAAALGVGGALRLIGYVDDRDLAALYRGATAKLFVSFAEGFGYPVVEAMAAGCPVIASDRSSVAEVAGDAALAVDPDCSQEIADAWLALLDSRERARWVARGKLRAARFSVRRMAEGTREVYRRVLRSS